MSATGILRDYLVPPAAYVGRHRVFVVLRPQFTAPVYVQAFDRFNNPLGATAVASGLQLSD